jgi:HSP20 family protein
MSAIETAAASGGEDTIGQAITQMERLYRTITGKNAPHGEGAYAIPAEKDPGRHVEEQLDRLMNVMARTGVGPVPSAWTPSLSVWEAEKELVFCLDLPGVTRDAVTVQIEGNLLTVSGERPMPSYDGARLRWSERPLGAFRRVVQLPPVARNAAPTAQVRDGLLEIRIPRETVPVTPPKTVNVS